MALSPALAARASAGDRAYEMKFRLTPSLAADVERQVASALMLDPHAEPTLDDSYHITTLCTDTPRFDVFHRVGAHRYRKWRLRRYGDEPRAYLERKTRHGDRVSKRRHVIEGGDFDDISASNPPKSWADIWHRRSLVRRGLWPICVVSYLRRAFAGEMEMGPLRITFDRQLRGAVANGWSLVPIVTTSPALTGEVICEFKFHGAMPTMCKQWIAQFGLQVCGFSKYRACVRKWGLVDIRQRSGDPHDT